MESGSRGNRFDAIATEDGELGGEPEGREGGQWGTVVGQANGQVHEGRVVVERMSGSYADIDWHGSARMARYLELIERNERFGRGEGKLIAYKVGWSSNAVRPQDVLEVLCAELGEGAIDREASGLTRVFECAGVAGQTGRNGGGMTIFATREIEEQRVFQRGLKYREEGGWAEVDLEVDAWEDQLRGQRGIELGILLGDWYDARPMRVCNAEIARKLQGVAEEWKVQVQVSVRNVNIGKSFAKGDAVWVRKVYVLGGQKAQKVFDRRLRKEGRVVDYFGSRQLLKIGDQKAAQEDKNKQGAELSARRREKIRASEGRRLHIYRLNLGLVGSDMRLRELRAKCALYGEVEECGIKETRKGRPQAWAWVLYRDREGAERAMEGRALSYELSAEPFSDELVVVDMVDSTDTLQRMDKQPEVVQVGSGNGSQAVGVWSDVAREQVVKRQIADMLRAQEVSKALEETIGAAIGRNVGGAMRAAEDRLGGRIGQVQDTLEEEFDGMREMMKEMKKMMREVKESMKAVRGRTPGRVRPRADVTEEPGLQTAELARRGRTVRQAIEQEGREGEEQVGAKKKSRGMEHRDVGDVVEEPTAAELLDLVANFPGGVAMVANVRELAYEKQKQRAQQQQQQQSRNQSELEADEGFDDY
jgi:hypothetical protein